MQRFKSIARGVPLEVKRLCCGRTGVVFFFRGDTGIISVGRLCLLPLLALERCTMLPRSDLSPESPSEFDSDSMECELDRSEPGFSAMSLTEMRIAEPAGGCGEGEGESVSSSASLVMSTDGRDTMRTSPKTFTSWLERIICEALLYESTMRCTPHCLTKLCRKR